MKRMKFYWTIGALLLSLPLMGQGWMKFFEYPTFDSKLHVVDALPTLDSGIMVLAGYVEFTDITRTMLDTTGMMLLKFNKFGELIFTKSYQTNEDFGVATDLCQTLDNGYVIGGLQVTSDLFAKAVFIRVNQNGIEEWQHLEVTDTVSGFEIKIVATDDNGIVWTSGVSNGNDTTNAILKKIDALGNIVWSQVYNIPGIDNGIRDPIEILLLPDGGFLVCGVTLHGIQQPALPFLIRSDSTGNLLWQNVYNIPFLDYVQNVSPNLGSSGGFVCRYNVRDIVNLNGINEVYTFKIDSTGVLETVDTVSFSGNGDVIHHMKSINGALLLSGYNVNNHKLLLLSISEDGQLLWRREYGRWGSTLKGIINYEDYNGDIIIIGDAIMTEGNELLITKADSNGIVFSSALTGHAHLDPESDCLPDPTETGLANWLVQAQGAFSFATLTDSLGHFTLPIDTGTYEVIVTPAGPYWDVCNSPTTVNVTAFYDTTLLDFPVQAVEECPYLEVDISVPFLRRCFDNTYTIHYCNHGTVAAEDASVAVTLDPYLTYQSSTIPFSSQSGNTLSFDLGNVAVNECSSFQITAYLDCDSTILGQVHCSEAHIFPDSLCIPPNAQWDGSSIEVDLECTGDSVIFIITNTGTGDMAQPLDYIIIEDQIVLMQGNFDLDAGQSTTVAVAANGTTFHLEAQQSPEHPSGTFSVGSTIEGCGGWLSLGFFLQWANGNPNPFVDVDCQANIGAFDPNDKTAFPEGFTELHLIEPGTDIEYLLRFQNTGTDTAFKVVVVDVLPPELDLATVRPGASSHAYAYSVTPEGWLVFTFENIMLPDSNVNEPGSHGFVRFRVSQKTGLGWGNQIANSALIYFDFNAPIRTNTTIHRIGQVFPWSVVGAKTVLHPKATFRILPNPFTDRAILQVEGIDPGELRLTLTDATGQILRMEKRVGTSFEFQRNELPSGVYFFKIERDGAWLGSGKLMIR